MDPLTSAAASGFRTSLESLDVLSNNLANTQTTGYKTDREFYDLYTSADASDPNGAGSTQMPDITTSWTDYSQGALQVTSNQLDFGIMGQGFFAVNGQDGSTLYTRNGSFRLNATGQLTTQDGLTVQDTKGKPIQLDPSMPIDVDAQGTVRQGGQDVAQLAYDSFANPTDLSKQGSTYFRYNGDPKNIAVGQGEIQQGRIEASNVATADSAVRLVTVMRQFEMLQKAMNIGADMNKQAIDEVAKSGQ